MPASKPIGDRTKSEPCRRYSVVGLRMIDATTRMKAASPTSPAPSAIDPTGASTSLYQPFAGHPPTLVEATVERVVASRTFRRSQRHRTFLRHVVRAALDGRQDELKEVVIGIEVFGREIAQYDPRRDPIVRVEAGRVRDKLARYYESEGCDDALRIQIPVGGYLPQFARQAATKPAPPGIGSFAVLPFTSLSRDPDDVLFCEALADELVDLLSRVPGARVVGRGSASKARGQSIDMKVLGKLLGVGHVVEGSVQRAGSRYRCIAQLIRTRDRACVWSQRFEHRIDADSDLFAFQDLVADAVVAAIARPDTLGQRPETAAPIRQTGNVAARDLYERARYLVQLRTTEGIEKGIALLRQSIALDPDFAPAHSQLGIARSLHSGILALPILPAFAEVARDARRAIELDPLDGDAHALLADVAFRVERDWPSAEPIFRKALRAAPNSASAHQRYAAALVFNGRYLEAVEHARIAFDLDPLNITMRIHHAIITAYARDFATAVEELIAVLDIDPDHVFSQFMLGSIYIWGGEPDDAKRHFDIAARLSPDHPIPQFNRIFVEGFSGRREQGKWMLDDLMTRLQGSRYQQYNVAMTEAYLGDVDATCAALRRSAAGHELLFVTLPADPSFDRMRDEPAFVALMDEYGLPRLPPSPFASSLGVGTGGRPGDVPP